MRIQPAGVTGRLCDTNFIEMYDKPALHITQMLWVLNVAHLNTPSVWEYSHTAHLKATSVHAVPCFLLRKVIK
jgi:hypothetical protein